MDDIGSVVRLALGLGAEAKDINVAQMALRAVVVFAVTAPFSYGGSSSQLIFPGDTGPFLSDHGSLRGRHRRAAA